MTTIKLSNVYKIKVIDSKGSRQAAAEVELSSNVKTSEDWPV